MTICKVPFQIVCSRPAESESASLELKLLRKNQILAGPDVSVNLAVRGRTDAVKRTFRSRIDGSVQYFALRQADQAGDGRSRPGIALSCHGAGVAGIGQARSYPTKSWLHLVAPTNRRKFGFDWEDFGRGDAMEVLELARQTVPHDPSRVYVTGHSMGGHGAWHLATTFPDRFAAVGPSAGWISYARYSRRGVDSDQPTKLKQLLARGSKAGDALELISNLQNMGVYILHGQDDDNVPVEQARTMAKDLDEFHHDWKLHEEPGKRHWWSNEFRDGGATCMDWPEMYDMFARHALPPEGSVRHVDFMTVNPGVSSRCYWLGINEQQTAHAPSRARIMVWPNAGRYQGTTDNIALLVFDTSALRSSGPLTVSLDGQMIEQIAKPSGDQRLWLRRTDGEWRVTDPPSPSRKGPHRYGAPKDELRHRLLFVVGTGGSKDEALWTAAKARYDAETFWYRGNATVNVTTDREFNATDDKDRTVVLYGNADTNSAWSALLPDSPIQVRRNTLVVGKRTFKGPGLSALFVRPRPGSDIASVIAIGGTGPVGMRACQAESLFVPFVHYPDYTVWQMPGTETSPRTVVAAGYFGMDWSLDQGELVWVEE